MNRDFDQEYRDYTEQDLPDLWNRIEPNLAPRDQIMSEDESLKLEKEQNEAKAENQIEKKRETKAENQTEKKNEQKSESNAEGLGENRKEKQRENQKIIQNEELEKRRKRNRMVRRIASIAAAFAVLILSVKMIQSGRYASDFAPASDSATASDIAADSVGMGMNAVVKKPVRNGAASGFDSASESAASDSTASDSTASESVASDSTASESVASENVASETATCDTAMEETTTSEEAAVTGEVEESNEDTTADENLRENGTDEYMPLTKERDEYVLEKAKLIYVRDMSGQGLYEDEFTNPVMLLFLLASEDELRYVRCFVSKGDYDLIERECDLEVEQYYVVEIEKSAKMQSSTKLDARLLSLRPY